VQGHRGARGLWPENTLEGFVRAAALGVGSIELDVVVTRDGVPVVFHDPVLTPGLVRDAAGRWLAPPGRLVSDCLAAELAVLDVGRWRPGSRGAARFPAQAAMDGEGIPRLDAVCRWAAGAGMRLDLDVKAPPGMTGDSPHIGALVEAVLGAVCAGPALDWIALRAFNWHVLHAAHRVDPALSLVWLSGAWPLGALDAVLAEVARMGPRGWRPVWAPDYRGLRRRDAARAQAAGLRVKPWTVNAPASMRRLMAWGVDGLCTDRPDLALAALRAARGEAGFADDSGVARDGRNV
jgi:glycerophosphoryl diester phosphodiesterase